MLPDSFLSLYTIIYSVSTIKEQTMLSILCNITIKRQKCVIITTLNLAEKSGSSPSPQKITTYILYILSYAQRKTHGFF